MERLTEKINSTFDLKGAIDVPCPEVCERNIGCETCLIQKAFQKLAHYEDLEEQGLLLKLPCKMGTKVYHIAFNYKTTWKEKIVETTFSLEMLEDYKKWWFLTKAEAEKALAEMEKE